MPPTAKKYKVKEALDVSDKSTLESPEKTVVSGQLEKSLTKKRQARPRKYKTGRGVVFVKNLPNGFFEDQLQKYFQQFGNVTRVRLARSARTGGSKGFAFVEFSVPEVAEIAAETMNNYLMFRKLVKAAYIPPTEQKFNYFRSSVRCVKNKIGKPVYVSFRTRRANKQVKAVNDWTEEAYAKRVKNTEQKIDSMKRRFADIEGFDVDSCVLKPPQENGVEKSPASVKSESSQNRSKDKVDIVSQKSPSNASDSSGPKQKAKKLKSDKVVTVESLLEATIDEDDSSDDDFVPDDKFDASEEEDEPNNSANESTTIPLKRLLEETIEEDSDDDDFDPESDDDSESAASGDDDAPQKSMKKALSKILSQNGKQNKLEKMIKRKPHEGGIQKKGKAKGKPQAKSQALREKIQESVKEMAKQKQVGRVKPKTQKRARKGRA